MRVKLFKISTNIIRLIITDVSPPIENGTLKLFLFIDRQNQEFLESCSYNIRQVDYQFDFSKKLPRNIGDLTFKVVIEGVDRFDEARKVEYQGKPPRHLSGIIKKVRYDFRIVSKHYNGSEAYFFKKINGDEKCPDCWDEDLMASNNTACKTCGGTGHIKRFTNPFKTICSHLRSANDGYFTDMGGKELNSYSAMVSSVADLILTSDDILYYVNTSEFYRVVSVTLSNIKSYPVLQGLNINILPSNSPDARVCRQLLNQTGILK